MNRIIILFLLFILHKTVIFSQSSAIDPTFNAMDWGNNSGVNLNGIEPYVLNINDGELLIAGKNGRLTSYNGLSVNGIIKTLSNGLIDTSFQVGAGLSGAVTEIVMQNDGKYILTGYFETYDGDTVNNIVRILPTGERDTTFRTGVGFYNPTHCLAMQPDGKILIGGFFNTFNGTPCNKLIRLLPDGTLDSTFNLALSTSTIYSIKYLNSGKLMVHCDANPSLLVNTLMRINADGSTDFSFELTNTGYIRGFFLDRNENVFCSGEFTIPGVGYRNFIKLKHSGAIDSSLSFTLWGNINDFKHLANGGYAMCGSISFPQNSPIQTFFVFNAQGELDSNFIYNEQNISIYYDFVTQIQEQADGKLILSGLFQYFANAPQQSLVRIHTNGTVDKTFAYFTGLDKSANVIEVDSLNRILVGGNTSMRYFNSNVFSLFRLLPNGDFDTTFQTNIQGSVTDLRIQHNGKILVAGGEYKVNNVKVYNYLFRLNDDGSLDTSFAMSLTSSLPASYKINTIEILGSGNILLGGDFTHFRGFGYKNFVLLNPDGTINHSLDSTKKFNGPINKIVEDQNGKILVVGDFVSYANKWYSRILRLNSDFSIDTTFNSTTGMQFSGALDVKIQADGKYLLVGNFVNYNLMNALSFIRLHNNGDLDTSLNYSHIFNATIRSVDLLLDGKIILGGDFTNTSYGSFHRFALFNQNGTIDSVYSASVRFNGNVLKVKTDKVGKTIVVGDFTNVGGVGRNRITKLLNCTNSYYFEDSLSVCDSLVWHDGITYHSDNSNAIFNPRTNLTSCDSIYALKLKVNRSSYTNDYIYRCDDYTWINGQLYSQSNFTDKVYLTNQFGCDSVVSLQLTIDKPFEDEISVFNNLLYVAQENVDYQWIDCLTNMPLLNETNRYIALPDSGSYAVRLTLDDCSYITDCFNVNTLKAGNIDFNFEVFPNPTQNLVNVKFANVNTKATVALLDIAGKILFVQNIITNKAIVDLSSYPDGVYFIKVQTNESSRVVKVVKS